MKYKSKAAILVIILVGCTYMDSNNVVHSDTIKIGMTKAEVNELYPCLSEELVMIEAGQLSNGCKILFRGKTEFILVFEKNEKLCKLITSDTSFRLNNGVGIGSTFADLKRVYVKYKIMFSPGYGRLVIVDDGTVFGFSWTNLDQKGNAIIHNTEKVEWMEFDKIPLFLKAG